MTPTVGRVVHFHADAKFVAEHEQMAAVMQEGGRRTPASYKEGEAVPFIFTRINEGGTVNGHVMPDGPMMLWLTDVVEGKEPGQWSWPPMVK